MKLCLDCQQTFASQDWRCPQCGWAPGLVDKIPMFAPALADSGGGFKADYFEVLAGLEAQHFWFNSRNALIGWALQSFYPQAANMLEIGCGTGYVLANLHQQFPQLALTGSDIFSEGLRFARARTPSATFLQMDALQIPYLAEFDVAGAFDVLEHIADDTGVLRQMHRALKPGGGLLITVPQHPALWSAFDEHSCHQRRYTRPELVRKVEQAGFAILHATSFVSLLLPMMFLARQKSATRKAEYDLFRDLRISPMINFVAAAVMRLEQALLQLKLKSPAGGSLLLIGRRI